MQQKKEKGNKREYGLQINQAFSDDPTGAFCRRGRSARCWQLSCPTFGPVERNEGRWSGMEGGGGKRMELCGKEKKTVPDALHPERSVGCRRWTCFGSFPLVVSLLYVFFVHFCTPLYTFPSPYHRCDLSGSVSDHSTGPASQSIVQSSHWYLCQSGN